MAFEIKGINNVLKKLNNLSKIETKNAVEEVAKDIETTIKEKASVFSSKSEYVKACEARTYGNSCFVDIGLKNDEAPFEEWKELWYQQWGFDDYGWNFKGQYHITNNLMWFDDAVQYAGKQAQKKLKEKLKQEVEKCWKG